MVMPPRIVRGLTIIELMIVVAIIAVILSLAAPSFKRTIEMQRLRGIHDQAMTDLQFARSEAVRTGTYVSFRMLPANAAEGGCYIIYSDPNITGTLCSCRASDVPRCPSSATTGAAEIKSVQIPRDQEVSFSGISITSGRGRRLIFDPVTGGTFTLPLDGGTRQFGGLTFLTQLDGARALQGGVLVTGRPSTCAPTGSTIPVTACP